MLYELKNYVFSILLVRLFFCELSIHILVGSQRHTETYPERAWEEESDEVQISTSSATPLLGALENRKWPWNCPTNQPVHATENTRSPGGHPCSLFTSRPVPTVLLPNHSANPLLKHQQLCSKKQTNGEEVHMGWCWRWGALYIHIAGVAAEYPRLLETEHNRDSRKGHTRPQDLPMLPPGGQKKIHHFLEVPILQCGSVSRCGQKLLCRVA